MLTLPGKFKTELLKKNQPSYIVKMLESEISNEQTFQGDWAANSGELNVDYTPTPPATGDVILVTDSTWTERSNPKQVDLQGVAYGNGLFVAVGNPDVTDSYIVTSPEGVNWTERSNPKNKILKAITYGNGLFVAVGDADGTDAYVLTSPDGIVWTERSNPKNKNLYGVTYGNGLFVAVGIADGTDAYIVTSPDGINWTEQSNPKNADLWAVAYGNGLFVAVGIFMVTDIYIVTSPDGTNWTKQNNSFAYPACNVLYAITYGNGLFVAAGLGWSEIDGGFIATSSNGINRTWAGDAVAVLKGVAYRDGIFFAVGHLDGADSHILKSVNGTVWTEMANPGILNLNAVTCGNGLFVTVGTAWLGDALIMTSPIGYYGTGYIRTRTMDVGSVPSVDGQWWFQNLLPFGTSVTYEAWASTTGAFAGEETSLGTVVDGQAITVRVRYYRVKATLHSNIAQDATPTLRSIMARFPTYRGYSDNPLLGYEAALGSVSALSTKISDSDPSSISQVTVNLAFTKSVSDYLKTKYPKNKEVRLLAGFIADGFTEADYFEYYRGLIDDWSIEEKDIVSIKIKDFSKQWDVPVPSEWKQGVSSPKTWTAMHPVDVMLDIFRAYVGSTDAELDQTSFNDVKLATPGWVVTRTITGTTIAAKDLLEELRKLLSAYFIPQPNGRIKLKRFSVSEAAVGDLTDRDFITKKWEANAGSLINQLNTYYNWDGDGDDLKDFTAWDITENATSKANWKETVTEEILDNWTRSAQSSQVEDRRNIILGRYANPPEKLTVSVDMRFMEYETGDVLNISTLRAPSSDMTGIADKAFQIIQKNPDFAKDRLSLTLLRRGAV